jgi:hypothetical protein
LCLAASQSISQCCGQPSLLATDGCCCRCCWPLLRNVATHYTTHHHSPQPAWPLTTTRTTTHHSPHHRLPHHAPPLAIPVALQQRCVREFISPTTLTHESPCLTNHTQASSFPILVRECSGVKARLLGRYGQLQLHTIATS